MEDARIAAWYLPSRKPDKAEHEEELKGAIPRHESHG